jgi:hypothetical protein
MTTSKKGRRHRLLLYTHMIDRLWSPLFPVGLLLTGWMWVSGKYIPDLGLVPSTPFPYDLVLYFTIVLIFSLTLYSLVVRKMAYVQAKKDHLRISTPFLAFNVSYRRILRAYPSQVSQLFKPGKASKSVRSLIEDFDGETALVLETKGFPLSPFILKLFLGKGMLNPERPGFVLLVPDWMALSTEIETLQGESRQRAGAPSSSGDLNTKLLVSLRKK